MTDSIGGLLPVTNAPATAEGESNNQMFGIGEPTNQLIGTEELTIQNTDNSTMTSSFNQETISSSSKIDNIMNNRNATPVVTGSDVMSSIINDSINMKDTFVTETTASTMSASPLEVSQNVNIQNNSNINVLNKTDQVTSSTASSTLTSPSSPTQATNNNEVTKTIEIPQPNTNIKLTNRNLDDTEPASAEAAESTNEMIGSERPCPQFPTKYVNNALIITYQSGQCEM